MANSLSQIDEITSLFKQNQAEPVYFIAGEEDFFSKEIAKAAETYLIDPASRDFNFDQIYSGDADGSQLLASCLALPMMSDRRLIIVHDFELLKIPDTERFIQYLDKPEQSTVLILIANKIDKRKKVFSSLIKKSVFVDASPLNRESDVIHWIQKQIRSEKRDIEPAALRLLYEHIGNNLFELKNQLEKLITYKGSENLIQLADIEAMTGLSREYNAFEMMSSILKRKKKRSVEILKRLLEQGDEAIAINGALFYRFNKQWQAHQLIAEKKNKNDLAKLLAVSPYFIQDYISPTKHFSLNQISDALRIISETDLQLKSSGSDPKFVIQFSIQKLLNL